MLFSMLPVTSTPRPNDGPRVRPSLLATAARFGSRREGAVAIMFGLALVPLLLFAGAALDHSRATDAQTYLAAAADAAALSTVTRSAMAVPADKARDQALEFFKARAASFPRAEELEPHVTVTDANGQRTAVVTFKAKVATTLMRLAGHGTVPIGGDATASTSMPQYIDFHLLLDNTPSMGVGATTADIATMVNNTGEDKCAFACHDLSAKGKDNYALAKKLNVTMRIDVVRQATQKLMDTAEASAVLPNQFRAAVHTFGESCAALGLATVSGLSNKLKQVQKDAAKIDLMTIPYQNFYNDQCTDYDGTLAAMDKLIPAAGNGSSAASPQKVLFFVSDGVADAFYPSTCSKPTTGGRCQEPIKPSICNALKDRGVKIAVLYTSYLPLPTNGWYNTWIAPFAPSIGSRMADCASPGLYFEVSPSQGISEAMDALFQKTLVQARLTH